MKFADKFFGSSVICLKFEVMAVVTRKIKVVCFLLGNSPVSGVYMPTFRNNLSVPSS